MTITLDVGSAIPYYPTITAALNTIGAPWDDDVLIQVHENIIDSVNFGHLTESTNNLTIEGIGETKPVWTSNTSHNFSCPTNPCHVVFKNLELKQNTANKSINLPVAKDCIIDQCYINGSADNLVYIDAGTGESCNAIITNSIITKGIELGGTYKSYWKIQNNTWYAIDPAVMLRIAHTSTNPTLIV